MNYSLHIHYTGKILLGKNVAGLHASHYLEDGEPKYEKVQAALIFV